jgi:carbonic anhydrase
MWYLYLSLAVLTLLRSVNCSCNYGTSHFPREASVPVNNYSYTGLSGPLNWYALNKTANALCSIGTHQSPIDIGNSSGTHPAPGRSIYVSIPNYPQGAEFDNLGTTVEVEVNGTLVDGLVDGSKTYNLTQFHFHTPSEHRINDEYFAMEMHFVFEAAGIIVFSQYHKLNHIMFYIKSYF